MGQQFKSSNTFEGGLLSDFHPLSVPNHTYTDALNMEIITSGKDQNIFQNIKGDLKIVDLGSFSYNNNTYKFVPLGVEVHNNIAYILAGAFSYNKVFIAGTIGSFPSPDWDKLNDEDIGTSELEYVFRPFHNFSNTLPAGEASDVTTRFALPLKAWYESPFISKGFFFDRNRYISMVVQPIADRSVNIIFTDFNTPIKIINSRFKATEVPNIYEIAEQRGDVDSNQYSDADWDRIKLIQDNNFTVSVTDINVSSGGALKGGGYRYFFKYITDEKNTTNIIYESPFFPIAQETLGITKNEISDKMVSFTVTSLDRSYRGIELYFAHTDGMENATMEIYKLDFIFLIADDNSELTITHTGREDVTAVTLEELNTTYTPIKKVTSIDIIHDRLALGGVEASIEEGDYEVLAEAAKTITIWEKKTSITKDYSDPNTVIKRLGYWPGEVYEFGVVFELANSGISPVFPITGMDNFDDIQGGFAEGEYPTFTIDPETGFDASGLYNNKGVFRMANTGDIYRPVDGGNFRYVRYLSMYIKDLVEEGTAWDTLINRFAIVKRKRRKNVLMQGMMCPTLKIPSVRLGTSPWPEGQFLEMPFSTRWVSTAYPELTRLGLNHGDYTLQPYDPAMSDALYPKTSFIPQPSTFISVAGPLTVWNIYGNISQIGDESYTIFRNNVKRRSYGDTSIVELPTQNLSFFSCELDLNVAQVGEVLTGTQYAVEIQDRMDVSGELYSPYAAFTGELHSFSIFQSIIKKGGDEVSDSMIFKTTEKVSLDRAAFKAYAGNIVKGSLISSGATITASNTFTGKVDRNMGYIAEWSGTTIVGPLHKLSDYSTHVPKFTIGPNSKYHKVTPSIHQGERGTADHFAPIALMTNSFSVYLGIELDLKEDIGAGVAFRYDTPWLNYTNIYPQPPSTPPPPPAHIESHMNFRQFADHGASNIGHLANIFSSSEGRWSSGTIIDLYKQDTNDPYFTVTSFLNVSELSSGGQSQANAQTATSGNTGAFKNVFRGDAYISSIHKRVAYKSGIAEAQGATASDSGAYGVGITKIINQDYANDDTFLDSERNDRGLNLLDNGYVVELVSYSNINADLRSIERVSDEETAIIGYDRDFYPHKKDLSSDARPDSSGYNHGYTGDLYPVPYFKLDDEAQFITTEFPNRIMLTEKHSTDTFYNSYRDLRGLNYKDYGIAYGPIIRIIALKTLLLSIHPTGVLSIGVEERTLMADGSSIFVDTAAVLNPTPVIISEEIGSLHAESIVKTDYTVYGVDYAGSSVWVFLGDKLKVISEFIIKSLLDEYKRKIEEGDFDYSELAGEVPGDVGISFRPRVYTTYNKVKHTVTITYVAEEVTSKNQYEIGTVVYNTVEQRWISRRTKGIKFSYSLSAREFVHGVHDSENIWESDSLVDLYSGKIMRNNQQGEEVPCSFEIVINDHPTFEKILENLQLVSNKNYPDSLELITEGEYNQAADQIWGEEGDNEPTLQHLSFDRDAQQRKVVQDIVTRDNAPRTNPRLGILTQNAYYKNNNLYIEVGKTSSFIKDINNKRIRDKAIRVRFVYTGSDALFIQQIISVLSLSSS